jgi:IPT/TIG domain/FG-GAP repeat
MGEPRTLTVRLIVSRRAFVLAALLATLAAVAFTQLLAREHASRPVFARVGVTGHAQAVALPVAALAPVSAALAASDRAYEISATSAGLAASNPAQRLGLRFARSGVQLSSLAAPGAGLRLRLGSVGYGTALRALDETAPRRSGDRVVYAHAGVSEWYVNGPLGLEQGFTLARPPSALPARRSTTLTLAVTLSGDMHAALDPDGQGISLTGAHGAKLSYGSLVATDARGDVLRSWLALRGRTVLLGVDTRGARYPLRIDPVIQQLPTLAPGAESEGAEFGFDVALSADGNTALVSDRRAHEAAWVFTRSGSTWTQQGAPLAIEEESPGGHCGEEPGECGGRNVALSADGDTALIGAPYEDEGRGAVWVFTRSGTTWEQQGEKLTGGAEELGDGRFGRSVALSADGDTALVGAAADHAHRGAAWVFTRSGSTWEQQGEKLTTGEEHSHESRFGRSVALSADGDTALIGAPGEAGNSGAVWVFTRSGSTWEQPAAELTGGAEESGDGRFGFSVALSSYGNTALIGARGDSGYAGAAWVFARSGSTWEQQGAKLTGGGEEDGMAEFGYDVALSGDGEVAVIGARKDAVNVGAAWLFTLSGSSWEQQGAKLASLEPGKRDEFATGVATSSSGGTILFGGPFSDGRSGAAWAFADESVPTPTVTSVDPVSGPSAGGTPITVVGSGFVEGATTVELGGTAASSVDVLSESELTAVTGAHAPGAVEVAVSDENGASTGGPTYTYVTPTPTPTPLALVNTITGVGSPNASSGVLSSQVALLPAPVLGVSGNLEPVSGQVFVKLPGTTRFVALTSARQVPFGTIINAIHGKVTVTTMGPDGVLQVMTFYAGEFELTQGRNGVVVAKLEGGDFLVCPTARERSHAARASSSHASGKHVVRKLWAEGHGSYKTQGNYASGAVLGTRWLTEDRCDGTLIHVSTDSVAVINLVTHRHLIVRAGHSYVAKAL